MITRFNLLGTARLIGIMVALAAAFCSTASAATYYVAPAGSDSNPGTLAQPFRTLQKALTQAVAGDEIFMRAGVYRDAVATAASGTAAQPIRISAYFDGTAYEQVELRGLRQIVENADGAGAWVLHDAAKNIYRIQLTEDWDLKVGAQSTPSNQVFADGEILIEARWPNIGSYLNMRETDWALGRGSFTGSANPYNGSYAANGLDAFPAGSLAGSTIVFNPGQRWFVQQAVVNGNSGNAVQFSFNKNAFNYGFHMPDDGDRFFLTKSLALLDAPGEWFFDSATNILYLRMPDSASPSGRTIEMRRNDRFLDLSSSNHLRFENLRFTATFIFSGSGNHGFAFVNCRFAHLTNGLFRSGMLLNGNGNQVLDSTFLGDAGTPVHLRDGTTGNVVENNVVGDAHYLDGYGVAVSVQGAQSVRHNTVFNAGGHGISVTGTGAVVQRNHVYYFGTLVQDVAGINAFGGGNQGGAQWSHNVVHDGLAGYGDFPGNNGAMGIRIDNGGATRACYNVVIHHNLVWGVTNSGLNIWGVQDSQLAPGDTQASVNIRLYNNTVIGASKMVGRTSDGFKFSGISWRNNILDGPLSGNNNDSLSTATIQNNLLRSGSIAGNTVGTASFVDAGENDYRLAPGSPGIDAGQVLPPYTDGVADGQPDLGAFERGQLPWRAGAVITAADLADLTLSRDGENDFVLRGLPPGRTVPEGFRVLIGGVRLSSPEPVVETDLVTHETTVHLAIDVAGLTGNQLIEYSLDGTTFLNPGRFINVSNTGVETVEAPSHLSFYNPSNNSVTLLWRDNSANEEAFEVQIASDLNFSTDLQTVSVPANETARVFSGLVPDKTYYFRVQAKNSTLGDSIYSPVASVRVGRMGLTLRHPDDDGTEFAIAFNPVKLNLTDALVTITAPAVTALRFAEVPIPAGATILEANLQFKTGVEYTNTVARARFRGERVANSAPLLAQQYNLRNRLSAATTALVDWDNIPPWYQDEVTQRQMSPDLKTIVQEIVSLSGWQSGNALTFLVQDNGSSSWEATRSFSTADDSLSNTTLFVRFTTPAAPSVAVAGLTATASGQNGVNLTWTYAASGQSGFRIERSGTGTRRFEPVAVVGADARTFSDSGLNPGTTYYYRIRPINSGGFGPTSPVASTTTEAQPPPLPPAAPSGFAVTGTTSTSITLAWTDNSANETSFVLERSSTGLLNSYSELAVLPANSTSFTDNALASGTRYFYRLRAQNAVGTSAWAGPITASTDSSQSVISNYLSGWYRGRTTSSPASSLTTNGTDLVHFTGGTPGSTTQYTQLWRYFDALTLADGEALRLDVTFAWDAGTTIPNLDRVLRFGFFNSNGTKQLADIGGDNNSNHYDDYGYGVMLASGNNTTSRYIEDAPTETTKAAMRDGWVVLGADFGSASIAGTGNHTLQLEFKREGFSLRISATVNGVLLDGGRVVANPSTFTYDMLQITNRSGNVTWRIRSLSVAKLSPAASGLTPLESWRLEHFGTIASENLALDSDDADNDGVPNLLEYALGGDPLASLDQAKLPVVATNGNHLTLGFTPQNTAGLRYIIEASSDLVNWSETTDITEALTEGQPYIHLDSADLSTTPRRFLRLRVVR